MKNNVALIILLILGLALSAAGCVDGNSAGGQAVTYNVGSEPETLDPALITGTPEFHMILQMYEGLTRLDEDNRPQPACAERWEASDDFTEYTFYLRDGLKWSNGDPLTAYDFEYAWKRAVDPNLAADYCYMFDLIEGAADCYEGEGSAEDVAVEAVDEKTLKVKLVSGAPYFLDLTAFPTYYPVHRETVEADHDGWHLNPETTIVNGPFKLVKREQDRLEYAPNENYWDAGAVRLNRLVFTMVEDINTELTMFENGEIDMAHAVPGPEIPRLKEELPDELHIFPDLGTYFYFFNCEKEPFDDVRVRRALTMAIDRETIVEEVTGSGQVPAYAFVPPGIADVREGSDFRQTGGDYFQEDVEEAKRLLAEAGYPEGKDFPPFNILYNTNEMHKMIAEVIMEMWRQNLGIATVALDNQDFGIYMASMGEGKFDLAKAGWSGDYVEPNSFLDMWRTGGGNNISRWSDSRYDQIIKELLLLADPAERMPLMHEQEKILLENMPIIPIFYDTTPMMVNSKLKGYLHLPTGGLDFKKAYLE